MKYGLTALGCLAFPFGQVNAATTITAQTKATGGTFLVDNGGAITGTGDVGSGVSTTLVMSYSVTGLDLSAEVPGATSVSFDFTVTYSSNSSDLIFHSGSGNLGISNNQVGGSELLTLGVSGPTNVMGFTGGTISLDGIVSAQVANFANTSDQQNFALSDGSNVVIVGSSDDGNPAAPAGAIVTDTVTLPASQGITGFDQSALTGASGFRTLRTQFTAIPEPSSIAMLSLCGLGVLIRRRK